MAVVAKWWKPTLNSLTKWWPNNIQFDECWHCNISHTTSSSSIILKLDQQFQPHFFFFFSFELNFHKHKPHSCTVHVSYNRSFYIKKRKGKNKKKISHALNDTYKLSLVFILCASVCRPGHSVTRSSDWIQGKWSWNHDFPHPHSASVSKRIRREHKNTVKLADHLGLADVSESKVLYLVFPPVTNT